MKKDGIVMDKKQFKVSPPWVEFVEKMKVLFENDDDIIVNDLDDGCYTLIIEVKNHAKFKALDELLPIAKKFGNVTLFIEVHDISNDESIDYFSLFMTLFEGNSSAQGVVKTEDLTGTEHVFVMFKPEVKQFFNDNLFDLNGVWSGLNQDIAKEVFEDAAAAGVHFCTDVRED